MSNSSSVYLRFFCGRISSASLAGVNIFCKSIGFDKEGALIVGSSYMNPAKGNTSYKMVIHIVFNLILYLSVVLTISFLKNSIEVAYRTILSFSSPLSTYRIHNCSWKCIVCIRVGDGESGVLCSLTIHVQFK